MDQLHIEPRKGHCSMSWIRFRRTAVKNKRHLSCLCRWCTWSVSGFGCDKCLEFLHQNPSSISTLISLSRWNQRLMRGGMWSHPPRRARTASQNPQEYHEMRQSHERKISSYPILHLSIRIDQGLTFHPHHGYGDRGSSLKRERRPAGVEC